ncbi:hypothetical protein I7I50_10937 [Histoplasma capsulatum G186AR]|uniref:Uncharacterized protein n=1 Tax=Ajellomyces capsulatus TaxID=5037 RepID=A0A8H8D7M4_AJECA|nr:hypothetical protein I7I52_02175 [Histoplasma capsulatum]QSS69593.1 hypothetical protein I7I50_10937 [Histoplasma capsulatum G186AR]
MKRNLKEKKNEKKKMTCRKPSNIYAKGKVRINTVVISGCMSGSRCQDGLKRKLGKRDKRHILETVTT